MEKMDIPAIEGSPSFILCRSAEVVDQIWVYGNSYESTLVAIVVPDHRVLTAWAKDAGLTGDYAALCKDPKVRALLQRSCSSTSGLPPVQGWQWWATTQPCARTPRRARCHSHFLLCSACKLPCLLYKSIGSGGAARTRLARA